MTYDFLHPLLSQLRTAKKRRKAFERYKQHYEIKSLKDLYFSDHCKKNIYNRMSFQNQKLTLIPATSLFIDWVNKTSADFVDIENHLQEVFEFLDERPIIKILFAIERIQSKCHHLIFSDEKIEIIDKIIALKIRTLQQYSKLPEEKRSHPPVTTIDTRKGENFMSEHGRMNVFFDSEIVEISTTHLPHSSSASSSTSYVKFSEHNKAVIQQQSIRGCTAAAAAMLICDNGKSFDPQKVATINIGTTEKICEMIRQAGLIPIVSQLSSDLSDLGKAIKLHGSAITTVIDRSCGHSIIVDAIDEHTARIRDPNHGWEISVRKDALARRYHPYDVIQIDTTKQH